MRTGKINGIEEKKDRDIRSLVIQTLGKIAPDLEPKLEEVVDIVHRLGKRMNIRSRNVVVLFVQRRVKEEIWRRSNDSPICKAEGIRFTEMLPWRIWRKGERRARRLSFVVRLASLKDNGLMLICKKKCGGI